MVSRGNDRKREDNVIAYLQNCEATFVELSPEGVRGEGSSVQEEGYQEQGHSSVSQGEGRVNGHIMPAC